MRKYNYFKELAIGEHFNCNESLGVKRSTRTAYFPNLDRVFYVGQNDLVTKIKEVK